MILVAVLIWQWPNAATLYRGLSGSPSRGAQPASIAQLAVLYEEDPTNPQGRRLTGSTTWHSDVVSPGNGKAPEAAIRADIEIPDRKMSVAWTLRRDAGQSNVTSHTIEIMFMLPPDFPGRGISKVPGVWMKPMEGLQGTALAGLTVKVTNEYFLIGLSATEREQNIQLLKERPLLEMPMIYDNNLRAILEVGKGAQGDRTFAEVFAAWEK